MHCLNDYFYSTKSTYPQGEGHLTTAAISLSTGTRILECFILTWLPLASSWQMLHFRKPRRGTQQEQGHSGGHPAHVSQRHGETQG